jgi:hypothetical protein
MRRRPILWILLLISGLVLAACASPAGSPDGTDDGDGGGQSEEPAASQGGGDGDGDGGFGTGSGSASYTISGGMNDSGELPFAGNFAYFQQAGVTFLVFTEDTEADEANGLIVILSDDGNVLQFVTDDLIVPTAECEWNVSQNDSSGAAGSFTCNDAVGFSASGAPVTDLDISGDFDVDL